MTKQTKRRRRKVSVPKSTTKYQVGIVVKDARSAAQKYLDLFGIGPFVEEVYPSVEATVHGKPAQYKLLAFSTNLGPIELELIQVLEGEPIHKEFLETRGEGLHHIGLYVKDVNEEVRKWKEAGIGVLQKSKLPAPYPKTGGYAYMDTESLIGIILELGAPPPPGL